MRVIYNGYAATTYGKSSISITDRDGKEIYHSDARPEESNTEDGLKQILKSFVKGENHG